MRRIMAALVLIACCLWMCVGCVDTAANTAVETRQPGSNNDALKLIVRSDNEDLGLYDEAISQWDLYTDKLFTAVQNSAREDERWLSTSPKATVSPKP